MASRASRKTPLDAGRIRDSPPILSLNGATDGRQGCRKIEK